MSKQHRLANASSQWTIRFCQMQRYPTRDSRVLWLAGWQRYGGGVAAKLLNWAVCLRLDGCWMDAG